MNTLVHQIVCKINDRLQRLNDSPVEIMQLPDKDLFLQIHGKKYQIRCIPFITPAVLQQVLNEKNHSEIVLMTNYLTPSNGDLLQQYGIAYADMSGNIFFHDKHFLILSENHEKLRILEQKKTEGRAWSIAGLKLLFLLLTEQASLTWNYRKMAEFSGVSLGSVRYILADLKKNEQLLTIGGKIVWKDATQTMMKWCDYYIDKLLPNLERHFYAGTIPAQADDYPLLRSGECSLQCQGLLKSNHFLAYRCGNLTPCMIRHHWQEVSSGMIEIREPFWPEKRIFKHTVPILLIYADLLAENDPRCRETASRIFQTLIKTSLTENFFNPGR